MTTRDNNDGWPVQTRPARVDLPIWAHVLGWVAGWSLGSALRVFGWLVRHPAFTLPALAGLVVVQLAGLLGVWGVLAALAATIAGCGWWRRRWPESFGRQVSARARGGWRSAVFYRPGWADTIDTTALAVDVRGQRRRPKLVRVAATGSVDTVTIRPTIGQVADDYTDVADRLAASFEALDCRVLPGRTRHELRLRFLIDDPLAATVHRVPPAETLPAETVPAGSVPALDALPVAQAEDGRVFGLPLLGNHLLLAGATGAGKSNAVWAVLDALGPGIASGVVAVWGLDAKGGIELGLARRLFARFCYADPAEFADTLEAAVTVMRDRQSRMRGTTRLHTPTATEPLVVVLVDELAALTAYVTDRAIGKRITAALNLLLSQGRAVGVSVVGAVQDPRKETVPMRNLFTIRVALRTTEADDVRLILSDGARDRGARCDRIPESTPGVGFVELDGQPDPVRARFPYLDDDDLADMNDRWAPRPHLVVAANPTHTETGRKDAA